MARKKISRKVGTKAKGVLKKGFKFLKGGRIVKAKKRR